MCFPSLPVRVRSIRALSLVKNVFVPFCFVVPKGDLSLSFFRFLVSLLFCFMIVPCTLFFYF